MTAPRGPRIEWGEAAKAFGFVLLILVIIAGALVIAMRIPVPAAAVGVPRILEAPEEPTWPEPEYIKEIAVLTEGVDGWIIGVALGARNGHYTSARGQIVIRIKEPLSLADTRFRQLWHLVVNVTEDHFRSEPIWNQLAGERELHAFWTERISVKDLKKRQNPWAWYGRVYVEITLTSGRKLDGYESITLKR